MTEETRDRHERKEVYTYMYVQLCMQQSVSVTTTRSFLGNKISAGEQMTSAMELNHVKWQF